MATKLTNIFSLNVQDSVSPTKETMYQADIANESNFNKLFASVFDGMEARQLLLKNNLSNMLRIIAETAITK